MINWQSDRGKPLELVGLLFLLVFFMVACSRDAATIVSLDVKPLVAATYGAQIGPTLSEGVAVVVQSESLEQDSIHQIAVSSPDAAFRWEQSVQPFTVGEVLYVGVNDLLLPPDLKVESGLWSVELYTPEGLRISDTFDFTRPSGTMNQAQLAVSVVEDMVWDSPEGDWLLLGVGKDDGIKWHYRFYDANGVIVAVLDSDESVIASPLFQDREIRESTRMVVAMRFDNQSGIYLMVRKIFT